MKLFCKISSQYYLGGELKEFPILPDATFIDNYNEELDSASIIITHTGVLENLQSYDYVYIYSDDLIFGKIFLIDNYVEKQINFYEGIYSYTINLMSVTKLLEKIQLPNRQWLFSYNEDGSISQKSIWQAIDETCELYIPKIKTAVKSYNLPQGYTQKNFVYTEYPNYDFVDTGIIPKNNMDFEFKVRANFTTDKNYIFGSKTETIRPRPQTNAFCVYFIKEDGINKIVLSSINTDFVIYENGIDDEIYKIKISTKYDVVIVNDIYVTHINNFLSNTASIYILSANGINLHGYGEFYYLKVNDYNTNEYKEFIPATYGGEAGFYSNGWYECEIGDMSSGNSIVNSHFEYEYLLNWNYLKPRFENIFLKDISLSKPTLRECLTAMMIQDSCIPVIKNRNIMFLDLKEKPELLNVDNEFTINFIERSMASDSYVNCLDIQDDNILDKTNYCCNEVIGFRDRNNVFLKQTENLFLETSKPIYNVKKLVLNCLIKGQFNISSRDLTGITISVGTISDDYVFYNVNNTYQSGYVLRYTVYRLDGTSFSDETYQLSYGMNENAIVIPLIADNRERVILYDEDGEKYFHRIGNMIKNYHFSLDITPLCVENNKRNLLNTNYLDMVKNDDVWTINDLKEYLYGTVGYTIGDNKITGFSSTYSYTDTHHFFEYISGQQITKTYIEAIYDKLIKNVKTLTNKEASLMFFGVDVGLQDNEWSIEQTQLLNPNDNSQNFASCWFDIEYQPLNNARMLFEKDTDIPIRLTQIDTSQSALTNVDDLALSEFDKINRFANQIVSINRLVSNYRDIGDFKLQEAKIHNENYTIFRRVISIGLNSISVNYFASKNYVIKNYFTSVSAKYRAFQYIDYNQAIIRKETKKVYCQISKDYRYNGDDYVTFDKVSDNKKTDTILLSQFETYDASQDKSLYYAIQSEKYGETKRSYKNEISLITYKNNFIINYNQFDNASFGLGIISNLSYNQRLGGLPQEWFMYNKDYINSLSFVGKLEDYFDIEKYGFTDIQANLYLASKINKQPKVNVYPDVEIVSNSQVNLTDAKSNKIEYYKDDSELINQSLQFEYYSNDVKLGRYFTNLIRWKKCDFENNNPYWFIEGDNFKYSRKILTYIVDTFDDGRQVKGNLDWIDIPSGINNLFTIEYQSGYTKLTINTNVLSPVIKNRLYRDGKYYIRMVLGCNEGFYHNICEFVLDNEVETYYVMLNDTKTNLVYDTDDIIIKLTYEVSTGNNNANRIDSL